MLSWIIQITVISLILIFLVHHLINFFKSTLTVPKIKDLVNSPNQKYENIFDIIKNNANNTHNSINYDNNSTNLNNSTNYSLIDLLPKPDEQPPSMKNELKNFLKKQLNGTTSNTTEIATLDSMSNIDSYSQFK
jgi:hypothetical protein